MINFNEYARIKDRYCLCYFGPSDEYVVQLMLLRPVIERELPGLEIHIGCKDELANFPRSMKLSEIKVRRSEFAHIKDVRFNGKTHPIEDLLNESNIQNWDVSVPIQEDHTVKCVVITRGNYPTKPLESRQIEACRKMFKNYEVEIDGNIDHAGMVIGVESKELFLAASRGVRTKLIPTGIGSCLYKRMFLNQETVHI